MTQMKDAKKVVIDEMRKLSTHRALVPLGELKTALKSRGVSTTITTKDADGNSITCEMSAAQANRTLTAAKRHVAKEMIEGKPPASMPATRTYTVEDAEGNSTTEELPNEPDPKPRRSNYSILDKPAGWKRLKKGEERTGELSLKVIEYEEKLFAYETALADWNTRLAVVLKWLFEGQTPVFKIGVITEDPQTWEGREDFYSWITRASGSSDWNE